MRVCWEDGAGASVPDPVTPGLLDLLTIAALASSAADDERPAAPRRLAAASATGSRRLWVEVEA